MANASTYGFQVVARRVRRHVRYRADRHRHRQQSGIGASRRPQCRSSSRRATSPPPRTRWTQRSSAGFFRFCRTPTAAHLHFLTASSDRPNSGKASHHHRGRDAIGPRHRRHLPLAVAPADRRHGREHDHRMAIGPTTASSPRDRRQRGLDPTNVAVQQHHLGDGVRRGRATEVVLTYYFQGRRQRLDGLRAA